MAAVGLFGLLVVLGVPDMGAAQTGVEHRIVLRGNRALSAAALQKAAAAELRAYTANNGRLSDLDDAAYQMTVAYRQAGYAFVVIDHAAEQGSRGPQAVFTITEGPRVFIRQITLLGVEAVSREELMGLFGPAAEIAKGAQPFVQADVDRGLNRILTLYRERGFLDARSDPPQMVFNADRSRIDLVVRLHEGSPYRVAALRIEGDAPPIAEAALEPLRQQWVGQSYHPRLKLILKNQLQDALGEQGYAEAQVVVEDRRLAAIGAVELAVGVDSGSAVNIEAVEVRGNLKTRERFIRRRLALHPGDRFNRLKLRESTNNLYRSGLFSRVDLALEAGSAPDARKLVVTLEEMPSRELFFEPGWGSYELLRLSLGMSENNLLGTGRRLGLELGGSLRARRAVLRYTDPWFWESAFTADLPLFYSYREEPSFSRTDYGASLNFSRELTPHLTTTTGYGLRKTEQSDVDVDPEDVDADQSYDLASLKQQFTYDDRDDPFYPTQGLRASVSLEHAATFLGGSVDFSRLATGVRYFKPLGWDMVLGLRYATGFIVPNGDTVNVPLAERFFNGGENSVRSFKEQELGPKDDSNNPVGGMAYNTVNIELRRRLTENLYGTVFADFGNIAPNRSRSEEDKDAYRSQSSLISATFNDYFSDMRPGIGVGLGYLLPIGPARVDWAFNPDANTKRDEDDWVLHFSIGMAF